ncbi:hypothetical protein [Eubacterium ramulus]
MKPDSDLPAFHKQLRKSCRHDLSIVIMTPYSLSLCDDVAPLTKGTAG